MKLDLVAFDHSASTQGGAEISNYEILSGLMAKGHSLTLCYESAGDLIGDYRDRGARAMRIHTGHLRWKERRAARIAASFLRDVFRVVRAARSRERPIFYCNVIKVTPLAALCARLVGCPLVVHVRISLLTDFSRQTRAALRSADRIIANSDYAARAVRALLPAADIVRVYNGINLDKFRLREQPAWAGRLRILYLGRIVPDKGVHVLLEALELLDDRAAHVEVRLCGSCPPEHADYLAGLEDRARRGSARIAFLGHRTDIPDVIHDSDLVVLPSIWSEAFGRVIVEAMACGKPVVASDVGGIPEVVGPAFASLLFRVGDAADLAAKIALVQRLYGDGAISPERLRARAEEFSLETAVARVEEVLVGVRAARERA